MARSAEEKQLLKNWMQSAFLPVWRGQVDDWESGLNYIADKTGWTAESIQTDILPWIYEWNRQKDAAEKAGKFMAELPNVGVFFRKQKWKNPLPYSFQELREQVKGEPATQLCACGNPAFNRVQCARCYTKQANPQYAEEMKAHLHQKGLKKQHGETWRDACMRCLNENGAPHLLPEGMK